MIERRVSTVAFYDTQKKILLQDRKAISKFGEEWGFFGGSLEKGETPEHALIREIMEELNFEIENFKFFKEYEAQTTPEVHAIEFLHTAPFPGFNKLKQEEGSHMKLFSIHDARKLKLLPDYYKMLNDLEKYFETIL